MMRVRRNYGWLRPSKSKVVVVAALAILMGAACGSPEPEHDVATEIIAFADGDGSIYTMKPDGSGLRQLTTTITDDNYSEYASDPAVAPDGSKIAYTRGSGIAVMNVDGTEQTTVTDRGGSPNFSPDGSKIVFGCVGGICLINADGSDRQQLSPEVNDDRSIPSRSFPSFSPDGTKIIFNENGYIAGFSADGTGWFQVLRDQYWNSDPAYSPDGSTIVFSSNRGGKNQSETYVMTADGKDIRALTTEHDVGAVYSPDGSKIVYTHGVAEPRTLVGIWVMNPDGSEPRLLTSKSLIAQAPSWGGYA
jgi:TolB protein